MSLSVHEAAHAWTADRLGDPTARMLGRITLNPLAHIDWIGTVLFPLIAIMTGCPPDRLGEAGPGEFQKPQGAAGATSRSSPLAGPVSNLVLAVLATPIFLMMYERRHRAWARYWRPASLS